MNDIKNLARKAVIAVMDDLDRRTDFNEAMGKMLLADLREIEKEWVEAIVEEWLDE